MKYSTHVHPPSKSHLLRFEALAAPPLAPVPFLDPSNPPRKGTDRAGLLGQRPRVHEQFNRLVVALRGSAVDLRLDLGPDPCAPPPECRGSSFVADGLHPFPNFRNSSVPARCSPSYGALGGASISSNVGGDMRVAIDNAPKQFHFLTVWNGRDRAA